MVSRNPFPYRRNFAQLLLCFFGVVPKIRDLRLFFFFLYLIFFAIDVKETSSAHPHAPATLLIALL